MKRIYILISFFLCIVNLLSYAEEKPNVIIIITDDQGYGDLGCHGNPIVKTPKIDEFYKQAVRLDNYHVDPTCAPTRAALMTGRYSNRVGVWHTIQGRNMLRTREKTMPEIFRANGYTTGIFGKWHLGDAYPYRPEDRGFDHVVIHGAGGVGQTPDYWGNDYFSDHYYINGQWTKFDGYCTDVWFDQAMKFMVGSKAKKTPFFIYIALNAPHGPLRAPKEYESQYKQSPGFIGMMTNIDDNFGQLQDFLKKEGLSENTILIYTTDNGSAGGTQYFTAGMRGKKGSEYEAGHRVPFFLQWPSGNLPKGVDVNQLTAHMDILPTFIDWLGLEAPEIKFDGTSIKKLLYGDQKSLTNRSLIVELQHVVDPEKWKNSCVMHGQWRLMNGKQLYDLTSDMGQTNDVSAKYPEIVQKMRSTYEEFWAEVSKDHDIDSAVILGSDKQNPTSLNAHDLMGASNHGQKGIVWQRTEEGFWVVKVIKTGNYQFSLSRWPAESDLGIAESCNNNPSLKATKACINIANKNKTLSVPPGVREVTFKLQLQEGLTELRAGFIDKQGKTSANYIYILNSDIYQGDLTGWQTREGLNLPLAKASKEYPLKKPKKKPKKQSKQKKKS